MSTNSETLKAALTSLKKLTELAIRQAKIEHVDGLLDTLAMRERAIVKLYGFDPATELPAAVRDDTRIPRWSCPPEYEGLAKEIRDLDAELNIILQRNLDKIRHQKQQLHDGEKYLNRVQTLYRDLGESRYLDHVG